MLKLESTVLVVVDVQGKLATLMYEFSAFMNSIVTMVKGAKLLHLPVIWLEQVPEKLGSTVPELSDLLSDTKCITKSTFSACGEPDFIVELEQSGAQQILLTGIETHICVYQTARDLLARNYEVEVVVDAVSSRLLSNKDLAINKMSSIGVSLTSVEMSLFELMKSATLPQFRTIAKLIQ